MSNLKNLIKKIDGSVPHKIQGKRRRGRNPSSSDDNDEEKVNFGLDNHNDDDDVQMEAVSINKSNWKPDFTLGTVTFIGSRGLGMRYIIFISQNVTHAM